MRGFGVETIGTDAGQARISRRLIRHISTCTARDATGCNAWRTWISYRRPGRHHRQPRRCKIQDGSGSPLRVLALVSSAHAKFLSKE